MLDYKAKIFEKTSDPMLLPQIRRLKENHYGAAFELMKILPAKFMLDEAERTGQLTPGTTVAESSSGTFALGLAILCAERGYKLIIVGDEAIDNGLKNRLLDLGTQLEIVPNTNAPGGIQKARLDRLQKHLKTEEKSFWPQQYKNKMNPRSYFYAAEKIVECLGKIDYLIATVGSGGSSQGLASALRVINPDMKLIGADSLNSKIFGREDGKRLLRGLGSSIYPENVDYELFDQIHWMDCAEGFYSCRLLHKKHQMFMGPTSGVAYMVGKWVAEQHSDAKVLSVLPDSGHRYINTAYDDEWLQKNGILTRTIPEPVHIHAPMEKTVPWCYYDWNKQTLEQVIGAQAA